MEGKNRQKGIVNNRISFERFVRLFVMIEIVLVFLYTKRFATFSVYGNRTWGLVIIVAVLALGSLVLSWKLERNWISRISGTLMPVLAYEAISMWRYSLAIRIMIIGVQFYGVAHKPLIDINDISRPDDSYVVIGALPTGDPILIQKDSEKVSIYNQEASRIEDDEVYENFFSFLNDLYDILGIGE
ncbi:MAG: hypothetical protein IJJ76_10315 [Ruminococcus sp.]|uniref:hypothetical protein n=1 Tax=Ruminococcus sp. TaxID=41978 RepID=UPI0025DCE20E|nr:hypothetical protein [Ruminococcus sp.]MBR0530136.1 hypothetical protein [Ruminococcus sp.]